MSIWDYIGEESKVNYLIEQLTTLIEKSDKAATIRPYDDIDLELFLEEYAVAIGLDEIEGLVKEEWERRKSLYDCVTDESARKFAVDALKDRFFEDGATFFKGSSIYATAMDWLDENYKLVSIPLDEDEDSIFICFDFTNAMFDADTFIDTDWYWYPQEIYKMIEKMKNNC